MLSYRMRKMKILANETCERFTKEGGDTGEEIYKVSHLTLSSIIHVMPFDASKGSTGSSSDSFNCVPFQNWNFY